jgi:6-phosphogluconolactonase (cycloisomerase 2 family)
MKFLISVFSVLVFSASSQAAASSHFVYVESNTPGAQSNSILAYRATADGTLTPLAGSPFATGGAGFTDPSFALGPFDSDQNIITNPEHTLLFAVNSGSNTISVFHIAVDGSLNSVQGSPFSSNGINPVSMGYENGVLVVVNKHQDPAQAADQSLPNYTSFEVDAYGRLNAILDSTVEVANGSSPSQALVQNNRVFGADFLGGLLQSFQLDAGHLRQNPPLSLPASEFIGVTGPRVPLGLALNPTSPILYVGYPTASKLGIYSVNRNGSLQFLRTVPNSGKAICWLRSNDSGTKLYTSNSADHSISVYDTSSPETPVEIQKLVVNAQSGLFQLSLDPTDSLLYVIEQRDAATIAQGQGSAIHVLKIDAPSGMISELNDREVVLNLPGDTRPEGIAVY